MSLKRKTGFTFILLIGAAFVIHAFTTSGVPKEYQERQISVEEFAFAETFVSDMSGFARKNAPYDFAARCLDAKRPATAVGWKNMREFGKNNARLMSVSSYNKEPERCRLHLENDSGLIGSIVCQREGDGALKFVSFTFVDPAAE